MWIRRELWEGRDSRQENEKARGRGERERGEKEKERKSFCYLLSARLFDSRFTSLFIHPSRSFCFTGSPCTKFLSFLLHLHGVDLARVQYNNTRLSVL